MGSFVNRTQLAIALLAIVAIVTHLFLRFGITHTVTPFPWWVNLPLFVVLTLGGIPLVFELLQKVLHRQFGSDLLAGISIVTSVILGEYLAGTFVVLMLSGGEALEAYAVQMPRRCCVPWPSACLLSLIVVPETR
ncbi:MAG: hypothetical protein QM703_03845 [Gemmatales bacterium]